MTKHTDSGSLLQLAIRFLWTTFSATPSTKFFPLQDIKHMIDLLRKWMASLAKEEKENSEYCEVIPYMLHASWRLESNL